MYEPIMIIKSFCFFKEKAFLEWKRVWYWNSSYWLHT